MARLHATTRRTARLLVELGLLLDHAYGTLGRALVCNPFVVVLLEATRAAMRTKSARIRIHLLPRGVFGHETPITLGL